MKGHERARIACRRSRRYSTKFKAERLRNAQVWVAIPEGLRHKTKGALALNTNFRAAWIAVCEPDGNYMSWNLNKLTLREEA